ncbi:MAG: methyltransferase domain-containing protein [Geobacter sp.]|nr:methyltransferase domain-containing protein [Geobacter sp.]
MGFNAYEFDEIARNVFAPAYPLLASQILDRTAVSSGACLDLGSGGGYLGLALAAMSRLDVCLLDASPDMQRIAEANITGRGLRGRVRALTGDVHGIPLGSGTFDLVASRSSLFFWEDPGRAFREIWRVLVPGGYAYIGGGFGSKALRDEIVGAMRRRDPAWKPKFDKNRDETVYVEHLQGAGIAGFEIRSDESGFWIVFRKPPAFSACERGGVFRHETNRRREHS